MCVRYENTARTTICWVASLAAALASGCPKTPGSSNPDLCGNGVIDTGEECDDGNTDEDDGCESCQVDEGWICEGEPSICSPICGNGTIEPAEGCDDGNTVSGDGCSATCLVETGWTCTGEPSVCTGTCGDGLVAETEECDDGNVAGGDGCSGSCTVENYFRCEGEPSSCRCAVLVDLNSQAPQPDGRIWDTAYLRVQDGIDTAADLADDLGTVWCEVWITYGVYHVYESAATDTVVLRPGVSVFGGFSGSETRRADRDWAQNVTILDGTDGGANHVEHVVTANGTVDATLDGFTITGGDGEDGVGMAVEDSSLVLKNCVFSDNHGTGWGGGMLATNSFLVVENTTFESNIADVGGGMASVDSTPVVANCIFEDNSAYNGGGMENLRSEAVVTNSVFTYNTSEGGGGAGMLNYEADASVTGCEFWHNSTDMSGGAMSNHLSDVVVTDTDFLYNAARYTGAGMNNTESSPVVERCLFEENVSTDANISGGAAMDNYNASSPQITDCVFRFNSAHSAGGAIRNTQNSSPTITNCLFDGNSAATTGGYGGAMRNESGSSPTVINCIFIGNHANYGGGIFSSESAYETINSTFAGNAGGEGGAIYNGTNADATLTNCVIWGNSAMDVAPSIFNDAGIISCVATYSNVEGGYPGNGNLNADPSFVDFSTGDLRLLQHSPCIDAANGDVALSTDANGDPRYDHPGVTNTGTGTPAYVDMGALEYQQP